jgi:hypothetical protein
MGYWHPRYFGKIDGVEVTKPANTVETYRGADTNAGGRRSSDTISTVGAVPPPLTRLAPEVREPEAFHLRL